jgi:peptidoglycan/xylan/chitin deacetylase (PgdA/CDA1 family)
LERNPEAAAAIREAGWDVVSHGYRFTKHYELTEAQEREEIRKAVASLTASLGQRPLGWYCRYSPGVNTRRLLVEEGGFLYDSNSYADDLPYWVDVGGKPHLVVPHTFSHNDNRFARGWISTAGEFFTYLKDAFDVLYREGEEHPKFMTVSLHNRLSGHPARSQGVERFLDYVAQIDRVWIASRLDVARHWHQHHRP